MFILLILMSLVIRVNESLLKNRMKGSVGQLDLKNHIGKKKVRFQGMEACVVFISTPVLIVCSAVLVGFVSVIRVSIKRFVLVIECCQYNKCTHVLGPLAQSKVLYSFCLTF